MEIQGDIASLLGEIKANSNADVYRFFTSFYVFLFSTKEHKNKRF